MKIFLFTVTCLDYCQMSLYNIVNKQIFSKTLPYGRHSAKTVSYLKYVVCLTLMGLSILYDQSYIHVSTNNNTRVYFTRIQCVP